GFRKSTESPFFIDFATNCIDTNSIMRYASLLILWIVLAPNLRIAGAETVDDLLAKAKAALAKGKNEEAATLANKAVDLDGKSFQAYFFRGRLHESLEKHEAAVRDLTKAISL